MRSGYEIPHRFLSLSCNMKKGVHFVYMETASDVIVMFSCSELYGKVLF